MLHLIISYCVVNRKSTSVHKRKYSSELLRLCVRLILIYVLCMPFSFHDFTWSLLDFISVNNHLHEFYAHVCAYEENWLFFAAPIQNVYKSLKQPKLL